MKRHGAMPLAAFAGLLLLVACNEQTPQDAAAANMGGDRRDDATPPGELPAAVRPDVPADGTAASADGTPAPPVASDGRPPAFERAPPEIVPDAALEPPPS
jgi:hypothetical protein